MGVSSNGEMDGKVARPAGAVTEGDLANGSLLSLMEDDDDGVVGDCEWSEFEFRLDAVEMRIVGFKKARVRG